MATKVGAPWRIELLGWLRAVRGDRCVTHFRTQKVGMLLAYLAYRPEVSHPREELIDLLWPESPPLAARNNLSSALSALRAQFETGRGACRLVEASRAAVQLRTEAFTTDVRLFEEALAAAAALPPGAARGERLSAAVELYRGELLPGFYTDWVLHERERLHNAYLRALRELLGCMEKEGRLERAIDVAHRLIAASPLDEEAHRDLIRLQAKAGAPAAALEHYHAWSTTCERELGVPPAASTAMLAREIEAQLKPARSAGAGSALEAAPPLGTVTFLAVELDRRSAERPGGLRSALARAGGRVIEEREEGKCLVAAFHRASVALGCAQELAAMEGVGLRMALDTGEAALDEGGAYRAPAAEHARALLGAAHPGQVLCSERTRGLSGLAPGERVVEAVDLGLWRLEGQSDPERLYQVNPVKGRAPFPPPRAVPGHRSNLPRPLARLIGRDELVAEMKGALEKGEVRLLTITGPGGVGKSRLGLEVASELCEALAGAAWLVRVSAVTNPRQLGVAIRCATRVKCGSASDPVEDIAAALGRERCLVLLDGFERLVETGGVEVVRGLLGRVPRLALLVTSRQRLGLAGEREVALGPLPAPPPTASAEELKKSPAVQLLLERAGLDLKGENASAVGELCRRLEGLPLALEIAGARLRVVAPDKLLERLQKRLDLEAGGREERRHKSLRTAIDWSYDLLPVEVKRTFARLAVFCGGWTLEEAEAVLGAGVAMEHLGALCERSLVVAEEVGEGRRYQMLDLLREYAGEKLSARELKATGRRHAEVYTELAERSVKGMEGPEQARWLARLRPEQDNFRTALEWCRAHPEQAELGLRLATALGSFWVRRGLAREGFPWLLEMLTRVPAKTKLRAAALEKAGLLARVVGDHERSRALSEEALQIWRDLGDATGAARALNNLSTLAWQRCELKRARALLEEGLATLPEKDETLGTRAGMLGNLGVLAYTLGDYALARARLEEALGHYRTLKDEWRATRVKNNLVCILGDEGKLAEAESLARQNLETSRALGDEIGTALALVTLAEVEQTRGNAEASRQHGKESLALFRKIGEAYGLAACLTRVGEMSLDRGERTSAIRYFALGLAGALKVPDPLSAISCMEGLAEIFAAEKPAPAARLLGATASQREKFGAPLRAPRRRAFEHALQSIRGALGRAEHEAALKMGASWTLHECAAAARELRQSQTKD